MAKKKSSKKTAAQSTAKANNKLQSILISSAAIGALVVAGCFAYLGVIERSAINDQTIRAQAQTFANSQMSLVDQAVAQLRFRLKRFTEARTLLSALNKGDQAELAQFQLELSRAFPEALSAKLIPLGPLGIAALDKDKYQLRNNIELDLLRYASNGEVVEPEAYKVDGRWLFSLAEAVKVADAKHASGALLVTMDQDYLQKLIAQLDSTMGQTSLIQPYKNKQHLLVNTGSSGDPRYQVSADATASPWQVQFIPSAELINKTQHSGLIIWILMGVALLAVLAAMVISLNSLQKALADNLANLVSGKTDFNLPGFSAAAKALKSKTAAPAKAKKADSAAGQSESSTAQKPTAAKAGKPAKTDSVQVPADIPETIFRAYDIRGLAEQELTDEIVHAIGLSIGSEALDQGQQTVIVASDGRNSSPRIREAMINGLLASGRDVIDIGMVPTPLMYFATHQLGAQSGVMITGSHNPAEYNGIKIVIGNRALSGQAIQALRQRILSKDLATGSGHRDNQDIEQAYIDYIINDVAIAQPLKIVLDAGNGVAGAIAPRLFEELGCEIIQLYCEVDGNFPNHHPDPTVEANLADLKTVVAEQGADLGIAFDGDGDRLGVVTATGKSVAADRLLMLLAQDVVSRNPGADVIFDVKCTRNLNTLISNYGGRPIMWKTGHSFMKEKMVETGALLGGEFSGHIFFKERWFGFDDGMYAAARLIEILSTSDPDLDLQLEAFPDSVGSPELKVATSEEGKFQIIEQLVNQGEFGDGKVSTLDGVRVDFPDGWGLVRASNTTPMLILRFEADSEESLARIQVLFKEQLLGVDPGLQIGF